MGKMMDNMRTKIADLEKALLVNQKEDETQYDILAGNFDFSKYSMAIGIFSVFATFLMWLSQRTGSKKGTPIRLQNVPS